MCWRQNSGGGDNPRNYEVIFVDDGPVDRTLQEIKQLSKQDAHVSYISFSRNFGKEEAMYAGLQKAAGGIVAIMDVDLQDPPSLLAEMYAALIECPEYDLCACRRVDRTGESFAVSVLSRMFYRVMGALTEVNVVSGARDFRVMRRSVVDAILSMTETNRFSKGIFEWVSFKTKWFAYHNKERAAGETKWPLWKLFCYSLDGITAFSTKPLHLSSVMGILSLFAAALLCAVIVVRKCIYGDATSGWPSMVCIILFIGGVQLFTAGILGQYIAKIFQEVKRRPLYIIREESSDYQTPEQEAEKERDYE